MLGVYKDDLRSGINTQKLILLAQLREYIYFYPTIVAVNY